MDKTTILRPRLSEKAYALSELQRTYAVDVPSDANKPSVANAVSAQFGVTVTDVRIMNVKGKTKRTVRKGGRPTMGKRSDVKKAYVTLKEGDKLPFFASPEDEKKADKKAKKEKETREGKK